MQIQKTINTLLDVRLTKLNKTVPVATANNSVIVGQAFLSTKEDNKIEANITLDDKYEELRDSLYFTPSLITKRIKGKKKIVEFEIVNLLINCHSQIKSTYKVIKSETI